MTYGAAILIIFGVSMLLYSPEFRALAGGILVLILIAGGLLFANMNAESERRARAAKTQEERYQDNWHILLASVVEIRDLQIQPLYRGSNTFTLRGAAKNTAKFVVDAIEFNIIAKDCSSGKCDVIGRKTTAVGVSIPADEVRGFSSSFDLSDIPNVQRPITWEYTVTHAHTP